MNTAAIEDTPPPARRWLLLLAVVFVVQVGLIFLLSGEPAKPVTASKALPSLQILPYRMTESQFMETFLATDPSLFVTANQHGFSGDAWLKAPPRFYEYHEIIKRTEPPFWLALNLRQFGNTVSEFIQTNLVASANQPVVSPPKIHFKMSFSSDSSYPAKTNSQMFIEGAVADRLLVNPPQLETWPHPDLLTNSIAKIAVDAGGTVLSSRLISRSGSEEADNRALEISRNLEFSPARNTGLSWGTIIFDWQTTAPAASTNEPVAPK